jgi:hypothetical protein
VNEKRKPKNVKEPILTIFLSATQKSKKNCDISTLITALGKRITAVLQIFKKRKWIQNYKVQ